MAENVVINILQKGAEVAAADLAELAASADKASTSTDILSGKVKQTFEATDKLSGTTRKVVVENGKLVSATESATKTIAAQSSATDALAKSQGAAATAAGILAKAAGAIAAAFSVGNIITAADAWTSYANQLRAAGVASKDLAKTQAEVTNIAIRSNSNLEATNELYSALTRNAKALRASQADVGRVTETISKAFALSGSSASAAKGAITQLNQAFASGVLRGDEFNSVMEQAPVLARIMAKEFTGSADGVDRLRAMAERGEISTTRLFNAIRLGAKDIDKAFAQSDITISQSLENLKSRWTEFIGNQDKATGSSRVLATAIKFVADNLSPIVGTILAITAAWIGYKAVVLTVAVAQAALNVVMAASPIGFIALALGAATVAFVAFLASTESGRAKLMEIGVAALSALKAVGTFLVESITMFAGWYTAADTALKGWGESISTTFNAAYDTVSGWVKSAIELFTVTLPNSIKAGLTAIYDFFVNIWTKIKDFVMGIVDGIVSAFNSFVDRIKSALNSLANAAKSAGKAVGLNTGGSGGEIAGARASGGPVAAGKKYLVGENGPELFVPGSNGQIVPNGSATQAANDNSGSNASPTRVFDLLTDAVMAATAAPFKSLTDLGREGNRLLGEILTASKATAQAAVATAQAASSVALGATASGTSNLNNFGIGPVNTGTEVAPSPGGRFPNAMPGGGGGGGGGGDVRSVSSYVKQLLALNEKYVNQAWLNSPGNPNTAVALSRVTGFISSIPGDLKDQVIAAARRERGPVMAGYPMAFRSGGQFTVGGSTGADSKVIPMRVSPGEQVDVRTRKQVRDEQNNMPAGNTNIFQFTIETQDADSFRRSERQVLRDFARQVAVANSRS